MNDTLSQWAQQWGVHPMAMADLRARLGPQPVECAPDATGKTEAYAQSRIRLEGPRNDTLLMRNNVGALMDARGVPVRYGLMNDSPQMNKRIKSGDQIGIERVKITQAHVGQFIGRFMSVECKRPGWKYAGDDHERAQMEWLTLVRTWGGRAVFATDPKDVW